ncbi:MAG TPA: glycosyltransferase 61 family protein [Roseovarius sp.]
MSIDAKPNSPSPDVSGPHAGVLLTGAAQSRRLREAGLYDSAGQPLPYCDIVSDELTTVPADRVQIPDDAKLIRGSVLFAGLVLEQFGHVLLNSLGRLWALEQLPKDTRLLFMPKRRAARKHYPHLRPVLDSLGIGNEFFLSKGPFAFEEVYLATDLFGERFGGLGAERFFDWLDRKWPAPGPVERGRKIYVTRSRLGAKFGRFAAEEHLEQLLIAQGYEVFAPEQHELKTQLSLFQRAERLIFAEGSALHLYAMVRRADQRVVVIQRRDTLPKLIKTQLAARPGRQIKAIHVLKELYWPPRRSDHLSVALLDFDRLREELVAANMIRADARWVAPTYSQERDSLNAGLEPGQKMLDHRGRRVFLSAIRSGADWSSAQAAAQGETKSGTS